MSKHAIVLIATLLMLWLTPANAQSASERVACHHDAVRFCKFALKGGAFTVASCLASHKAKLSPRCQMVLSNHGM